jgi:hypothetical protein
MRVRPSRYRVLFRCRIEPSFTGGRPCSFRDQQLFFCSLASLQCLPTYRLKRALKNPPRATPSLRIAVSRSPPTACSSLRHSLYTALPDTALPARPIAFSTGPQTFGRYSRPTEPGAVLVPKSPAVPPMTTANSSGFAAMPRSCNRMVHFHFAAKDWTAPHLPSSPPGTIALCIREKTVTP